jgi:putative ATPase
MSAPAFYRPVERGLEIRIAEKLRQLKARNAAHDTGRSGDPT